MPDAALFVILDPGLLLAVLVGAFQTCTYLVIRGRLGWHILAVLVAACVGAFLSQTVSARVGDVIWIGDFGLIWASAMAWVGIAIVTVPLALWEKDEPDDGAGHIRPRSGRA